jgi:hypothetical protein
MRPYLSFFAITISSFFVQTYLQKLLIKKKIQEIQTLAKNLYHNNTIDLILDQKYRFIKKNVIIDIFYGNTKPSSTHFFIPHFPAIKVNTTLNKKIDTEIAYLQEIRITYQNGKKEIITDSPRTLSIYPFYTWGEIFVDIPLWPKQSNIQKWHAFLYIFQKNHSVFTPLATLQWRFEYDKTKDISQNLPIMFQFSKQIDK